MAGASRSSNRSAYRVGIDYLDKPKHWDTIVRLAREAGVIGVDTEFYNVDPSKQSCVGRARIHVWSIAIRTARMGPMGFTLCRGWCLPAAALDYPPIVELLEDPKVKKELHNQPVDQHSFLNHGIMLRGARDTLNYVKWKRPELINTAGRFKLKALMTSLLGREPIDTFKRLVADTRVVQVPKKKKQTLKGCSCGVSGCRQRATKADGVEHKKWTKKSIITVMKDKTEKFNWPLQEIVPGHPRWERLVPYAIEDAIAALQIAEVAGDTKDPAPWPYSYKGTGLIRPGYSQGVITAVIKMEQTGFRRDLAFCTERSAIAEEDEQKVLNWLHRWYVVNSDRYGPHGRRLIVKVSAKTGKEKVVSGTDSLWTAPAKRLKLFDELGFPRSPVWAKGKVKQNKAKLDHVAMAWIMKNHPPAKQVGQKLLLLGRIRSGKKYLVKLRDAGDTVYPICGPAGDEDERSGAVTGRLGIKGELEAQQLPKAGEKDLYQVRRAIIA